MIKGFLFIFCAFCIDLFQGAVALLFTGLAAIPGVDVASIPLGIGVDVSISLVFGGGLVIALAAMGMFYPGTVLSVFVGETIPFLNILPGWTLMTWRCLHKKKREEKNKQKGFGGAMLGITLKNLPGREDSALEKAQWATQKVITSRQVDGIRNAKAT